MRSYRSHIKLVPGSMSTVHLASGQLLLLSIVILSPATHRPTHGPQMRINGQTSDTIAALPLSGNTPISELQWWFQQPIWHRATIVSRHITHPTHHVGHAEWNCGLPSVLSVAAAWLNW